MFFSRAAILHYFPPAEVWGLGLYFCLRWHGEIFEKYLCNPVFIVLWFRTHWKQERRCWRAFSPFGSQGTRPNRPRCITWARIRWMTTPWPWELSGRSFRTMTATRCFPPWALVPSCPQTDESRTSFHWWGDRFCLLPLLASPRNHLWRFSVSSSDVFAGSYDCQDSTVQKSDRDKQLDWSVLTIKQRRYSSMRMAADLLSLHSVQASLPDVALKASTVITAAQHWVAASPQAANVSAWHICINLSIKELALLFRTKAAAVGGTEMIRRRPFVV